MSIKGYITEWLPGRVQDTVQTFIVQADGTSRVIPGDLCSYLLKVMADSAGKHLNDIREIGERGLAYKREAEALQAEVHDLRYRIAEHEQAIELHRKAAALSIYDAVEYTLRQWLVTPTAERVTETIQAWLTWRKSKA